MRNLAKNTVVLIIAYKATNNYYYCTLEKQTELNYKHSTPFFTL